MNSLIEFVKKQNVGQVQRIIRQQGFFLDINKKTDNGYTALYLAVQGNSLEMVELLLKNNADPNLWCHKKVPLHVAIERRNVALARLLLNNGASVNIKDHAGYSPLMYTVITLNKAMVQLLLEYGAKTNTIVSKDNKHALILAKETEHSEIIRLLKECKTMGQ